MIASVPIKTVGPSNRYPDLLENGAHLSASEFLRRYEAMPEVKKYKNSAQHELCAVAVTASS